jgi:hypothetical protein
MPSAAVKAAVDARLATWSHIGDCPQHDINDLSDAPANQFLDVEYPVANEERINLGVPALYREEGAIRFVIYVAALTGVAAALGYADEIRDLFRDKNDFPGIDLTTFEASPPVFDSSISTRGYYPAPFVVPYHFDYEK